MENNGKLIISAILSAFLLLGCGKSTDKKVKIAYLPITHAMVLHEMTKDKTLLKKHPSAIAEIAGGWFIKTHSGTAAKIGYVKRIAKALKVKLVVTNV